MIEDDQTSGRRARKTKIDHAAEAWAILAVIVAIIVVAWLVSTI
ncbi:hypothetical protein [Sphingomonas sp. DC2300-3]